MYSEAFYWLMFGLILGFIILYWISKWLDNRPIGTAPPFCEICGCPIKSGWYNKTSPRFDKNTGKGVVEQRKWFECSKSPYHYSRRSTMTQTISVSATCDPVQTLGSQS